MDQPKKSPNNQKEKSISFIFMNQIWCFFGSTTFFQPPNVKNLAISLKQLQTA